MGKKRKGLSYKKRVADINAEYDRWAQTGLSNREIWLRYIYPRWGISERTMYNLLKAPALNEKVQLDAAEKTLFDFNDGTEAGR